MSIRQKDLRDQPATEPGLNVRLGIYEAFLQRHMYFDNRRIEKLVSKDIPNDELRLAELARVDWPYRLGVLLFYTQRFRRTCVTRHERHEWHKN